MAAASSSVKRRNLVIAIAGPHGSGKSTHARRLAEYLGLKYFSAGRMFREMAENREISLLEFTRMVDNDERFDKSVDEQTKLEAEKGGVVLDGLLSAWMAGELANLKLYLAAPEEARFRRIALRDGIRFAEARDKTLERDRKEKERFKRFYNIDIDYVAIYDLILNTELFEPDGTTRILKKVVDEYLARR